jgi:hypothetical protein
LQPIAQAVWLQLRPTKLLQNVGGRMLNCFFGIAAVQLALLWQF